MNDTRPSRGERSRHMLQHALITLIVDKGYEETTVNDILAASGVARATFYAHFRDAEDLLRSTVDNLRTCLQADWEASLARGTAKRGELGVGILFLRHVHESRQIHRAFLGRESGIMVDRYIRRMLTDLFRLDLVGSGLRDLDATLQWIVGGYMELLTWWMDREIDMTPEEVNAIFLRRTLPGLQL